MDTHEFYNALRCGSFITKVELRRWHKAEVHKRDFYLKMEAKELAQKSEQTIKEIDKRLKTRKPSEVIAELEKVKKVIQYVTDDKALLKYRRQIAELNQEFRDSV